MATGYFPPNDDAALNFLVDFFTTANGNLATLGYTAGEMTTLQTLTTDFDVKLQDYRTAQLAAAAAVEAKNLARKDAHTFVRQLVLRAYANPAVDDALRAQLGIKPYNAPSTSGVLQPTDLVAAAFASGIVELKWSRNANSPTTLFVVQKKTPEAAEWGWVASTRKTRFREEGQTPGVAQHYRVLAEKNGQYSPPSNVAAIYSEPPAPLPPEPG